MHTVQPFCVNIEKSRACLRSLVLYRQLRQDPVISALQELLDTLCSSSADSIEAIEKYSSLYWKLSHTNTEISMKDHILHRLLLDENPFTQAAHTQKQDHAFWELKKAAGADLDKLYCLATLSSDDVKACIEKQWQLPEYELEILRSLPEWKGPDENASVKTHQSLPAFDKIKNEIASSIPWSNALESICKFHAEWGTGIFSRYKSFQWKVSDGRGVLEGIEDPDPIRLSDLIGYANERAEVLNNTHKLLNGYPANNLLLYGDRGTGKSSTVKAIMNEYYSKGLRVIEVPKEQLIYFTDIVKHIKGSRLKFILFVDDLAFEDNEESYTALKAILEGNLERKPQNIVIYATSNRRHLVKERFSDRNGLHYGSAEDEVRAADNLQEKLSLSDRFGITVIFSSPSKAAYLEIVEGIAAARGLVIDKATLHREAMKWELWYNGRSPRTARQFVDWLEGEMGEGTFQMPL